MRSQQQQNKQRQALNYTQVCKMLRQRNHQLTIIIRAIQTSCIEVKKKVHVHGK